MPALIAISLKFKSEFIGTRPHANLQILVTHPKYQRRGAGGMLVDWGCAKADERGLPWVSSQQNLSHLARRNIC
jgi:GNAT superfamily N-acetyltransferase